MVKTAEASLVESFAKQYSHHIQRLKTLMEKALRLEEEIMRLETETADLRVWPGDERLMNLRRRKSELARTRGEMGTLSNVLDRLLRNVQPQRFVWRGRYYVGIAPIKFVHIDGEGRPVISTRISMLPITPAESEGDGVYDLSWTLNPTITKFSPTRSVEWVVEIREDGPQILRGSEEEVEWGLIQELYRDYKEYLRRKGQGADGLVGSDEPV